MPLTLLIGDFRIRDKFYDYGMKDLFFNKNFVLINVPVSSIQLTELHVYLSNQ
jgi:hypothetical protein